MKSIRKINIQSKFFSVAQQKNNKFLKLNNDYSRHTIHTDHSSLFYIPRESPLNVFKKFTTDVLPKLESFVEQRLLEDINEQLSPLEKEEIQDAFNLRRAKALEIANRNKKDFIKNDNSEDSLSNINGQDIFTSINGKGLSKMNYKDIGKYVHFTEDMKRKYFPSNFYGEYLNFEYKISKSINLMVREEALNIVSYLNFRRNSFERKPFIDSLKKKIIDNKLDHKSFDLMGSIKDSFYYYSMIYQDISSDIIDSINSSSSKHELLFLFSSADIYDGLINQIIANFNNHDFAFAFMCLPNTRLEILSSILSVFREKYAYNVSLKNSQLSILDHRISEKDIITYQFFYQIQKGLKFIDVQLNQETINKDLMTVFPKKIIPSIEQKALLNFKIDFTNNLIYPKDIIPILDRNTDGWQRKKEEKIAENYVNDAFEPYSCPDPFEIKNYYTGFRGFNSGIVLFGESGSGKSGILGYLHAWAKENNWVVLPIYRATRLTKDPEDIEQHINGLYLQNQLARELLLEIKMLNLNQFDKLLVNLDVYGKIDSTGVKDGSPDPMPSLWDEDRRVFTDSHKLFDPDEEASITKSKPNFLKRMSDYYPKPTTALDIINYGIDNTDFATNAFAEVLSMLSSSKEIKTMVLIDEYNEFFKESDYLSYKFANKHKGKIPPYAMSLVRLIMSLDGHLSHNFFKVFALSQSRYQRHTVNPSMLNMSYNFSYCVPNLKLNDVRYAVNYYNIIGLGYTKFNEKDILYLYTASQGNWKELQHFVKFPTTSNPSHKAYIERKIVQREIANTNLEIKKMLRLKGVEKNKKIRGRVEEMRKFYHQFDDYI